MFIAMDMMSRLFSPYDLNPTGKNPLRAILEQAIDFEALKAAPMKLFITATNVRTGRGRIFRNAEITPDVLLASACLPTLFQAIEIDGESYWDDTILIPINPVERQGTPRSAADILNRLNEVSFNSVLLKELRMIAMLRQVADPGNSEGAQWAKMRIHMIRNDAMGKLGYSSKLNAEWSFLTMLRDEGRRSADAFLAAHRDDIGKRSSLDLDQLLEGV
jgi:NTE family protein